MSFSPVLNLPSLKKKNVTVMSNFPSIRAPFYVPSEVMIEGTPVKFGATQDAIVKAADTEGADVIGLTLQETYDDTALGQLQGYHFANDTRQRLDGSPIGVLTGQGYAEVRCFSGTVAWGEAAYIGPSGLLVNSGASNAKLPVVFEGAGTDGDKPVRIRFNFPLASRS